jgi:hypothetical protein
MHAMFGDQTISRGPVLVFHREPPADRMPMAFAFPFAPARPAADVGELVPHHPELPALVHRLTPVEGLDLALPFGEVCDLLIRQIEAPQRLQPRHRLPCKADVFATRGDAPWATVLEAIRTALEGEGSVAPLTPGLAGRLGLEAFLTAPRPVVSLLVTEDPTASHGGPPPFAAPRPIRASGDVVPARFNHEWEFVISRKDAKAAGRAARRRSRSWWGRLWSRLTSSRLEPERERWRRQVAGQSLEEQLWGVRPTRRLLLDAATRRWVRGALEFAGYDPQRMLHEWEIYWRRKGV